MSFSSESEKDVALPDFFDGVVCPRLWLRRSVSNLTLMRRVDERMLRLDLRNAERAWPIGCMVLVNIR